MTDTSKTAFIVQTMGYWGRGPTPSDAAQKCKEAGAKLKSWCIVDLFVGDDKPSIVCSGMCFEHDHGAIRITIGQFTLGQLIRSKTKSQS